MGMLSCVKIIFLMMIQLEYGLELLFECPVESQWNHRAKTKCNITKKYFCLFDENKMMNTELCKEEPMFEVDGYKLVISGNVQGEICDSNRYQPFKFWSNGSSQCMYVKSFCNEEGQVGVESIPSSPYSDKVCRCDYTRGYDFIIKPKHQCYCVPAEEDCSCYYRHCGSNLILSPDYRCMALGEWSINFECSFVTSHSQTGSSVTPPHGTSLDASPEGFVHGNTYAIVLMICLAVVYVGLTILLRSKAFKDKCTYDGKHIVSTEKEKSLYNVPSNRTDFQRDQIIKWRRKQHSFVVTVATNEIMKIIKSKQCILITGTMGSGKSAIAYYAAFELEKEGFEIMYDITPANVVQHFRTNEKKLFLLDDVIGNYTVNNYNVEWFDHKGNALKSLLNTYHRLKIIMTCRSHIYNASNIHDMDISYVRCDLQTGDFKLTLNERKEICDKYLENVAYKLPDYVIMLYDFFPSLCNVFSNEERNVDFFEHPFDYLNNEINTLRIQEDFSYLALALLVVLNNNVDYALLNSRQDELLQDVFLESKFRQFPSSSLLLSSFKSLVGTFVNNTSSGFSFMNEKLFETVSVCVGKFFQECILKYSSSTFIKDRVQLHSGDARDDKLRIVLDPVLNDIFFQRLINDLKSGYITDVFENFQLRVPKFRHIFLTYIQKHFKAKSVLDKVDDSTVIHAISAYGYIDLLSYFISRDKPDINHKDRKKNTALHKACINEQDNIVEFLLKNKADLNQRDSEGRTAMHVACLHGNINITKSLLKHKASIFQGDKNKLTPFHLACMNDQPNFIEYLISKKSHFQDINITDTNGRTPLFIACEMNKPSVVQTLLKHKCDINKSTTEGIRPLQIACKNGNDAVVEALCNENIDVNQYTNDGFTPLIIACESGHDKVVKALLHNKAHVNKPSKTGSTPLYESCAGGHVNIVEVLLANGADVNQTANNDDWTPLFICITKRHTTIVELLLHNGADMNKSDKNGKTPICLATVEGNLEMVNMLKSQETFVNEGNKHTIKMSTRK